MISSVDLCPCHSKKEYKTCCKPFHKGFFPENALQLMRSRYAAYALNLSDYLISTTHPASPQYIEEILSWKEGISNFSQKTIFHDLEILDFKENGITATVTFVVYLSQEGQDITYTECSYFEKFNDKWLYRMGRLSQGRTPALVQPNPFRVLPLSYYGDPILRKKADPISEINDDIKMLVEQMVETMKACNATGLAAPQIHRSLRVFVCHRPIETGEYTYDRGEIRVFINPTLSDYSTETWKAPEGCLSIPTFRFEVERPQEVTVEYTSLDGKILKERASGWMARVIMHEYDHLEGILQIDRLEQEQLAQIMPSLLNLKKRIHEN